MGAAAAPIAIGMMVVGAAAGAYSAYQQTKAQKEAATYNADVQQQNAKLAEVQAKDTEARGRLEEDAYRRRLGQMQGQQLSALAATGVDISAGGSALDLRSDLATAGNLDALAIRQNAAREAYGQRLQGTSALAQARLSKLEASYAKPTQAATLSLAGSAGSFGSSWYAAKG